MDLNCTQNHLWLTTAIKKAKFYHTDKGCQGLARSKDVRRVHCVPHDLPWCSKCHQHFVPHLATHSLVVDSGGCGCGG